jgi:hypothetical protein
MRTDEHVKRDGEANRDSDIDWSYLGVAVRDGVVMRAVASGITMHDTVRRFLTHVIT